MRIYIFGDKSFIRNDWISWNILNGYSRLFPITFLCVFFFHYIVNRVNQCWFFFGILWNRLHLLNIHPEKINIVHKVYLIFSINFFYQICPTVVMTLTLFFSPSSWSKLNAVWDIYLSSKNGSDNLCPSCTENLLLFNSIFKVSSAQGYFSSIDLFCNNTLFHLTPYFCLASLLCVGLIIEVTLRCLVFFSAICAFSHNMRTNPQNSVWHLLTQYLFSPILGSPAHI